MLKRGILRGKNVSNRSIAVYFLISLLILNVALGAISVAKVTGLLIPRQPIPEIKEGVIDLDDLTLEQKIAQMVVTLGVRYYSDAYKKMQIGGVHLHAMESNELFEKTIKSFQDEMTIPFMITVDLEGCVNPFAHFKEFGAVSEIDTLGAAFEKGKLEGKYLREMGVTVDFAPVVDLDDDIWKCRSFPGDEKMVSELANAYILGMQDEGILATAKHYPGKTLVIKDPHKYLAAAEITEEDLYPYKALVEKGTVKAIMVSHLITFGEVNSEGKPSVASQKIIEGLREDIGFKGLIVTDEINMQGMRKFYDTVEEMYVEVFKAGADVVLNFNEDPNELYHMISVVKEAVSDREISRERIDASVRRILEFKGLKVEN
jgi:beta-N-acetylhexosaminidase